MYIHHASVNTPHQDQQLAHKLNKAIKTDRPNRWRGSVIKERQVMRAIYNVLGSKSEVNRIFPIIKEQAEY